MTENIRFLHKCVMEAVVEVTSGFVSPLSQDQQDEILQGQWDGQVHSVVIGFSSLGVHGSLVLCCREDFLTLTLPRTLQNRMDVVLIPDWFGELSNLILGRVQKKLLSYLPNVDIFPPSVAEMPVSILDRYSERFDTQRDWIGRDTALMCIQSCASFDDDFAWLALPRASSLDPGQVIFLKDNGPEKNPMPAAPVAMGQGSVMTQLTVTDAGISLQFEDGLHVTLPLEARTTSTPRVFSWHGTEVTISSAEDGKIKVESSDGICFRLAAS